MPDLTGLEALFVRLYFDRHIMTPLAVDVRCRGYDVRRHTNCPRMPRSM